jgi:hypothetical protein
MSYDGTWHTRGHSSTLGAAFVIQALTGLVIDYVVLSKFCSECEFVGKRLEGEERELWLEAHKTSCDQNHLGSSGSMETEGAKMLWSRSLDGDAAVLDTVTSLDPYPDKVTKEECINHISNRMYKGLERIVKDSDVQAKTTASLSKMSGRGKMTKERMKRWSSYYRKAIVENAPNIENARNAIWAIMFHSLSTPEDPRHRFCNPEWCWFRKAEADGRDPRDLYEESAHDPPLPKDICERLIPLFERLHDSSDIKHKRLSSQYNLEKGTKAQKLWPKDPGDCCGARCDAVLQRYITSLS